MYQRRSPVRDTSGWDEETRAYAAGFLDGEGCFTVGRNWKIAIACENTNHEVMVWFHQTFGGSLTYVKPKNPAKHRPTWRWQVVCREADTVCKWLAPYLKEKAPQAYLLIFLQQTMGRPRKGLGRRLDPALIAERNYYASLVKSLKQRLP